MTGPIAPLISEATQKTQNHVADWGDVLLLVLLIVVVLANVLHGLSSVDSAKFQNLSGFFGALTTFAGTAIGAYFGISASGAAARTAVNTATDASRKLGAANEQLATTQDHLAGAHEQIFAANKLLGSISVEAAAPEHIAELKTILGERQWTA